jgi:hypothetical protein
MVRLWANSEAGQEQIAYGTQPTGKAVNYLALVAYNNPTNTAIVNRLLA